MTVLFPSAISAGSPVINYRCAGKFLQGYFLNDDCHLAGYWCFAAQWQTLMTCGILDEQVGSNRTCRNANGHYLAGPQNRQARVIDIMTGTEQQLKIRYEGNGTLLPRLLIKDDRVIYPLQLTIAICVCNVHNRVPGIPYPTSSATTDTCTHRRPSTTSRLPSSLHRDAK